MGLILADVGEMALYGPGLDLEVPTTPAGPDVDCSTLMPLVELEPSAGVVVRRMAGLSPMIVLQESVDTGCAGRVWSEMFGGGKDYLRQPEPRSTTP